MATAARERSPRPLSHRQPRSCRFQQALQRYRHSAHHVNGTDSAGARSLARRSRRAFRRLGHQGFGVLGGPAFFSRPISAAGSHRLSRLCDCADRARTTAASATHVRRNTDLFAWRTIFDLGRPGATFAAAQVLEPKDHKAYLRTLLYPGRFCYSWITGLMGSNDDAVTFLAERRPVGLDVSLIERALQCRRAACDPNALFLERTGLPSQIEACATLSKSRD